MHQVQWLFQLLHPGPRFAVMMKRLPCPSRRCCRFQVGDVALRRPSTSILDEKKSVQTLSKLLPGSEGFECIALASCQPKGAIAAVCDQPHSASKYHKIIEAIQEIGAPAITTAVDSVDKVENGMPAA